ncbi:MAG: DUF934 domain-containing protein [Alcanivoracaceae bacterium]|nr:DUF934 domain-containing protein [Alcanivoracaceae bacterium]
MPEMIRDGEIVSNEWQRLDADSIAENGVPESGKVIVPLAVWQAKKEALKARGDIGVCLDPGEEPEALADDVSALPLVAINFPAFKDGRGYSYARELRTRFGFTGELRAVGDVLRDQLFYLWRVGFNAFEVRDDRDIQEALSGLKDYTVTYQGDVHDPRPIYRRA